MAQIQCWERSWLTRPNPGARRCAFQHSQLYAGTKQRLQSCSGGAASISPLSFASPAPARCSAQRGSRSAPGTEHHVSPSHGSLAPRFRQKSIINPGTGKSGSAGLPPIPRSLLTLKSYRVLAANPRKRARTVPCAGAGGKSA